MSIAAMESRCEFPWLASGIAFVLSSFGGRADACSMSATLDLGDIQYAHVVVVRTISEIFSNTSPDRAAASWWAVGSSGNFGRRAGPWPSSRDPLPGKAGVAPRYAQHCVQGSRYVDDRFEVVNIIEGHRDIEELFSSMDTDE